MAENEAFCDFMNVDSSINYVERKRELNGIWSIWHKYLMWCMITLH